jgi:hypothetical protein
MVENVRRWEIAPELDGKHGSAIGPIIVLQRTRSTPDLLTEDRGTPAVTVRGGNWARINCSNVVAAQPPETESDRDEKAGQPLVDSFLPWDARGPGLAEDSPWVDRNGRTPYFSAPAPSSGDYRACWSRHSQRVRGSLRGTTK